MVLTGGLVLTTGLVTASALSGSVEDPAVVSVDETPDADATDESDKAADKADEKAKNKAGEDADDEADDESDVADSDEDADEGAPADEKDGTDHEGHGSEISTLARETEPGPLHGSVVCAAASGGKCQQGHQPAEAGDATDEGTSKAHGKGHGKGHAARAGKSGT